MKSFIILALLCLVADIRAEDKKERPKPIDIANVENNVGKSTTEDGSEFFEGDMVKGSDKKEGSDRNAISDERYRWPTVGNLVEVPYTFSSSLNAQAKQQFLDSAADYAAWTCIKFVPRRSENDYIEVFQGGGCYSNVGRVGGKQQLSLGDGCQYSKGTPTHEMMHALGFYHEQSRTDRDQHVSIIQENVYPNNFFNFKICNDCKDPTGLGYDYSSVMHYGKTAFSQNGKDTIVPRKSGVTLGQRAGLCDMDIKKLNWMYKCNGRTASSSKPNGGVVPCKVPYDKWSNCADFKNDCANPSNDYLTMRYCPKTCAGVNKGDPYDKYTNCGDYKNECNTIDWVKNDCTLTCSQ